MTKESEQNEYTEELYKKIELKGFEACIICCLSDICPCNKNQIRSCNNCGMCCYVVEVKKEIINGRIKTSIVQMTLKK